MREIEARISDLTKICDALCKAKYTHEEMASLFITGLICLAEDINMEPWKFYSMTKDMAINYKRSFEKNENKNEKRKTEMR